MSQKKKDKDISGVFVPAGLLIGMGVGFLTNHFLPGLFIGLGMGLVVMAIIKMLAKK